MATGGLDGKGVVVGVVDTGLDVRHPDFRDARRAHPGRVDADRRSAGRPPPRPRGAVRLHRPEPGPCAIYAARGHRRDDRGRQGPRRRRRARHARHVHRGRQRRALRHRHPRYVGLAPGATLIVAAPASSGGFHDADILNAARFVFDMAGVALRARQGRPLLRIEHVAPARGRQPEPRQRLRPARRDQHHREGPLRVRGRRFPGRAIVVAAGNSGQISVPATAPCRSAPATAGSAASTPRCTSRPGEETRVPIVAGAATDGQGYVWVTLPPRRRRRGRARGAGRLGVGRLHGQGGARARTRTGAARAPTPASWSTPCRAPTPTSTPSPTAPSSIFTGHWADGERVRRPPARVGHGLALDRGRRATRTQALYFEKALRQGTVNVPASAPGLLAVGCTVNRVGVDAARRPRPRARRAGRRHEPGRGQRVLLQLQRPDAPRRAEARDQRARRLRRRGHERAGGPAQRRPRHQRRPLPARGLPERHAGLRGARPRTTRWPPAPRCRRRTSPARSRS